MTMTNREKYIIKRNEHDMLMHIYDRTRGNLCPLYIISDMTTAEHVARCHRYHDTNDYYRRGCAKCVQDWLNKEA
jgi:hypothetical protein